MTSLLRKETVFVLIEIRNTSAMSWTAQIVDTRLCKLRNLEICSVTFFCSFLNPLFLEPQSRFGGQTCQISSSLSPKRDRGSKGVKRVVVRIFGKRKTAGTRCFSLCQTRQQQKCNESGVVGRYISASMTSRRGTRAPQEVPQDFMRPISESDGWGGTARRLLFPWEVSWGLSPIRGGA